MKRILLALLLVALIAMPAFASVQNVKVSGNVSSSWLIRNDFTFGARGEGVKEFGQNLLFTQAIVGVDADLTDNVSAKVELLNEKAWTEETDDNSDFDVNYAYMKAREFLNSAFSIIIGRQPLNYGNSLIVGRLGPNHGNAITAGGLNSVAEDFSKRTHYDAIRGIIDYDPLTVDLVYAKINANTLVGNGNQEDDVDLYGINANWKLGDERNSEVEGYVFTKIDQSLQEGALHEKADKVFTPGIRVASNPIDGLWTSAEVAWQRGTAT